MLVSPGTLAAVDVYVWLTFFQFSSAVSSFPSVLTGANTTPLPPVVKCSTMATTLRLRSALRLPWYVVLLVATYCLLHLGLVVEHPCATQGSNPD